MKNIYAVSQGIYSDYRVVALFSTESDAKLFMERHQYEYADWNDIETYVLDAGVPKIRKGFSHYFVQMEADGSSRHAEPQPSSLNAKPDPEFRSSIGTVVKQPWFNWYGWAKNQQHALKSANEHRIKLLAQRTTVREEASHG